MSESGTPTSQTTDIFAKFPDQILWKKLRVSKISPLFVKNFAAMFWWMLTILTVALGLRPENVMEDEPLPCNERTQVVPAEMSKCLNTRSYGIPFFGGGGFFGRQFWLAFVVVALRKTSQVDRFVFLTVLEHGQVDCWIMWDV